MEIKRLKNWFSANSFKISILLILSGFTTMAIGNLETGNGNSFIQLSLSPILLLIGYSLIIFAIMTRRDY